MLERTIDYINQKIKNKIKLRYAIICYYFIKKVPPPTWALIDVASICNLRCPLCINGTNKYQHKKKIMSLKDFKCIIDKLPSSIEFVHFSYRWGESLLNPEIFQMLDYLKKRNIRIAIDTNFSFKRNYKFFINIVKSKLDKMTISLDGCTQKSYSKYRIGGNFNLVISNIKRLLKTKKEFKNNKPKIIWKFIINKFNEHEIKKANKMAKEMGIKFQTKKMSLSEDCIGTNFKENIEQNKNYWLPKNKKYMNKRYCGKYKYPIHNMPCFHLFNAININPSGKVIPCCYISNEKEIFGDLIKNSFEAIWNNKKFEYSRSLFSNKKYYGTKIKTVCLECNNFKKRKI
jgi:radical SAM protein with 4Fe4S-binding SPASM domain